MNSKAYIGATQNYVKSRDAIHKYSFNNRDKSHATGLSKYIWDLEDKNIKFKLKWKILESTPAYRFNMKKCYLYIAEKINIMKSKLQLVNLRNESGLACVFINYINS